MSSTGVVVAVTIADAGVAAVFVGGREKALKAIAVDLKPDGGDPRTTIGY